MKKITSLLIAMTAAGGGVNASLTAPCTLIIDSPEEFAEWTVIDENDNAPHDFEYLNGCAYYTQSTSYSDNANDWLISPAIELTAGEAYNITFSVQNLSTYSWNKQKFTIMAGTEPTAAMATTLYTETSLAKTSYKVDRGGTFSPNETGTYYFGLHLTSEGYNGDFAVYGLTIEKIVIHPGAISNLSIAAGENGAMEAILTWTWPTKNDQGGDVVTITGANIYRGTSSYFTTDESTLVGTLDDSNATPGGEGRYVDTTVPSSGKYYYKVIPFNAEGASTSSTSAVQSAYIGMASSVGLPTNVTASAVEGNVKQIALTWDAPTATEGYFNPDDVAYKITRSKDKATAETLETAWTGTQPYIDEIDGLGSYVYTVYSVFNGSTAYSGTQSNAVITGGTATLPYENSFNTSNDLALWTLFHGTDADRDWSVSSSALNYWGGTTADAWAVTPLFTLEAGKAYKVTFTARVNKTTSPKNLAVCVGTQASAEAMTTEIFSETISSSSATTKTTTFSIETSGDYCFGFHCFGPSDYNDLYVDDLKIEATETAPLGVSEAKAEAAPEGAPEVVLSWTNPTKTNAGTDLTAIDRVVISSGSTEVKVIENAVPGAEETETLPVDAAGEYSFAITAYLNDNASETVEVTSGWVGADTPKAPESVTVAFDENGARIIEFTPVSEGIHGGYVDLASLLYEIKRNDVVLISEQAESPYVDSEEITELGRYTYAVAARSGETLSDFTAADPVTLGDALDLPYTPDFNTPDDFDLWTLNGWEFSKTYPQSDKYTINTGKENIYLFTPPLNMKKGTCQISFKATCYNANHTTRLSIRLATSDDAEQIETTTQIATCDVSSVSYPDESTYSFDVPETGNYYIAIADIQENTWGTYIQSFKVEQTLVSTGIDAVEGSGAEADVRFFDLQGRAVAHPRSGQLLIKSVNGHASKIRF